MIPDDAPPTPMGASSRAIAGMPCGFVASKISFDVWPDTSESVLRASTPRERSGIGAAACHGVAGIDAREATSN